MDIINSNFTYEQQKVLNLLKIENIEKFEKETNFFSHIKNNEEALIQYVIDNYSYLDSSLSYNDFCNLIITFINDTQNLSIDLINEKFRRQHKELFIDNNAPNELKEAFYHNKITSTLIHNHKEYIPYLIDKDLINKMNMDIKINIPIIKGNEITYVSLNFISEYINLYGNKAFLELCSKYGNMLSNLEIITKENEILEQKIIEKLIRESISKKIIKGYFSYQYLENVSEFVEEYPTLFINLKEIKTIPKKEQERLNTAFYKRQLTFEDIRKYPELAKHLKNKNLFIAFGLQKRNDQIKFARQRRTRDYVTQVPKEYSDLELLEVYGNEFFLKQCLKYGRYLEGISFELHKNLSIENNKYVENNKIITSKDMDNIIEKIIEKQILLGNIPYTEEDIPVIFKNKHPELFLDKDAPEELKKYFYNYKNNYQMSFKLLNRKKEWIKYIENKSIKTSILRSNIFKDEIIKYFSTFKDKAIKLGIEKAETVTEMIEMRKVELMKKWYDKTGQKFLPDVVIMKSFPIEDADKFLVSASNWSKITRNKRFYKLLETREAILKLAYSFGIFDFDKRGIHELDVLINHLPKTIESEYDYIIKRLDHNINFFSHKDQFIKQSKNKEEAMAKTIEYLKNPDFLDKNEAAGILILLKTIQEEKLNIDFSKDIISQIYKQKKDGKRVLAISQQEYPKITKLIREILEQYIELPILTPFKAHQLFGGFILKYDPEFREFLLKNINEIYKHPEYAGYISNIQRQFSSIKAANSNRSLTLELAVSYVQKNKYTQVDTGNERLAEISAIAGYSQEDFNVLQQIYNYGKQRVFSTIPNIKKQHKEYSYEILKLDDPLALAVGTLTDCCQALGDAAELCMEHSMVDKNGRVFVIKDKENNIIAQSWVWRNKETLCFDNIEIPNKALKRASKNEEDLNYEIFNLYKEAARELIEYDNKIYKKLLDKRQITLQQYNGLKLSKVTVGLGYNDIAKVIKENTELEKDKISRPISFEAPVKLESSLYITDSKTQYILAKTKEEHEKYNGREIAVYNDEYAIYTDSNFNEINLLTLEKLEAITKEKTTNLNTSYINKEKKIISQLAQIYNLDSNETRIIMNPNFAIIYQKSQTKIKIADLLFNIKINTDQQQKDIENKVAMQIKLAINQIADNKKIDISNLNQNQQNMYKKALNIDKLIEEERGIKYVR